MKRPKPEIHAGRPMVFTNGAFVSPGKVTMNGQEVWCWIVESFEDDSYYDGEMIYPRENALNKDELLEMIDEESETV